MSSVCVGALILGSGAEPPPHEEKQGSAPGSLITQSSIQILQAPQQVETASPALPQAPGMESLGNSSGLPCLSPPSQEDPLFTTVCFQKLFGLLSPGVPRSFLLLLTLLIAGARTYIPDHQGLNII